MSSIISSPEDITASGYCMKCKKIHTLAAGDAYFEAFKLMEILTKENRIDFFLSKTQANPSLSTDVLFSSAKGKMFGVLSYENEHKEKGVLYAFSGQYHGIWDVPPFAPMLISEKDFLTCFSRQERKIKMLTRKIQEIVHCTSKTDAEIITFKSALEKKRKKLSQKATTDIQNLYKLYNFSKEEFSLREAFLHETNIPTGTADCAAPKLLQEAVKRNLKPLGLVEFFWGEASKSGKKTHGTLYSACTSRCTSILGTLLCGLEK